MGKVKPHSFRVIEGDGLSIDGEQGDTADVGAFLREARQTTGRSVEDIATSLHIRARFLRAIEDGRYEDLPGSTYAIGFIRSYSEYLGLDADALVSQFKEETSTGDERPDLDFPVQSAVGSSPTGKIVAVCVVLAVAIFGGWFYVQSEDSIDVSSIPTPPGFKADQARADTKEPPTAVAADTPVATPVAATDNTDIAVTNGAESEAPYQLPVSITALVEPDPLAAIADIPPLKAGDLVVEQMAPPEPAVSSPAAAETSNTETASAPAEEIEVAVETPAAAEPVEPEAASVAEAEPAAEPPVPPAPTPAVAESEPEPNVPAVQTAALPSVPAPAVESSNDADGRTFGVVNQEARVVIGARADSWVQVLDGEQNVVLTRMLRAGDRYLVPDRNDLVMLTGNAGGLVISVDGKEVPQIGSDGAILHNVRLDVDLLKSGQAVIE